MFAKEKKNSKKLPYYVNIAYCHDVCGGISRSRCLEFRYIVISLCMAGTVPAIKIASPAIISQLFHYLPRVDLV
jgi:hypothetical protein